MRATAEAILNSDDLEKFTTQGYQSTILPFEFDAGYTSHLTSKRPRLSRTHMRYDQLPRDIKKAKIIFMMRNPRDVCVSFYHFVQVNTVYSFTGSWDEFFEAFMDGRVAWGGWYDYMVDWLKHKDDPNILFVKYEDYLRNPEETIHKVASFIGKTLDNNTVKKIAEITSFKTMKCNPKLNVTHETMRGDWLRKGEVGDWVNYFTPPQLERIQEMYKRFVEITGVEFSFE